MSAKTWQPFYFDNTRISSRIDSALSWHRVLFAFPEATADYVLGAWEQDEKVEGLPTFGFGGLPKGKMRLRDFVDQHNLWGLIFPAMQPPELSPPKWKHPLSDKDYKLALVDIENALGMAKRGNITLTLTLLKNASGLLRIVERQEQEAVVKEALDS